ncbi:MAG: nucleoside phosphorylase [Bacilli bacterium]|nr:nucleoside phosphorylase [Bacilli bacterium]
MIKYSDEEGFIKAKGIKFREGQDKNIVLPKVAVGVFSRHLFNDVIEKFSCKEVGYISTANMEKNVYILRYKNDEITFFMAGVSGPWISADIEELSAQGVKKFVIFGNCGVLDANIEDCSIIIPTMAFRDEGTSYHYLSDTDTIDLNPKYIDAFIEVLNNYNFAYTKGYTWTTDAFYRETKEKINCFKQKGAVCVEMEGAVIASVCKRNKLDYFTFYYAGDNLDSTEWDERSLSGLSNLDKKKQVMLLALDLALKINN